MDGIDKLDLAKTSLLGLSVGDALGETYFGPEETISAHNIPEIWIEQAERFDTSPFFNKV